MKKIIVICVLMINYFAVGQTEVKYTEEEYKVRYVVEYFFEGFHESDSVKMRSVMHPEMTMRSIQLNKDGNEEIITSDVDSFVSLVAQHAKNNNWEEEVGTYTIKIDGKMAHVWLPYKFFVNNMMSHCGVNSIQLFFDEKEELWKIISILDTRRKKDCF